MDHALTWYLLSQDAALTWILIGLVVLGFELWSGTQILLWIGAACIGTGLTLMAVDLTMNQRVLTILGWFVLTVAVGMKFRRHWPRSAVNLPTAGLVGRIGILLAGDATGRRVRLGDSEWPARLSPGAPDSESGTRVRIEGVDGTTLVVRPE